MSKHRWTIYDLNPAMKGSGVGQFDFFQAVKLIEARARKLIESQAQELADKGLGQIAREDLIDENEERWPGVGETPDPEKELVHFKSAPLLEMPAADGQKLLPPEDLPAGKDDFYASNYWVNFMGLAGHNGPLPDAFTEWTLQESAKKNNAMADFLDIFNHRLISLLVRNRRKHRIGLEAKRPQETEFAHYLFSLLGLGHPSLKGHQAAPDSALLNDTGTLMKQTRSMPGLEFIIQDFFRVAVKGEQFIGRWGKLEPDVRTSIGHSGHNQYLGHSAVIGNRVWDQQSAFQLTLGPMPESTFKRFLPVWPDQPGDFHEMLYSLTRFYTDPRQQCRLKLVLDATTLPKTRLSGKRDQGSRLGWTTWLSSKKQVENPVIKLKLRNVHLNSPT